MGLLNTIILIIATVIISTIVFKIYFEKSEIEHNFRNDKNIIKQSLDKVTMARNANNYLYSFVTLTEAHCAISNIVDRYGKNVDTIFKMPVTEFESDLMEKQQKFIKKFTEEYPELAIPYDESIETTNAPEFYYSPIKNNQ